MAQIPAKIRRGIGRCPARGVKGELLEGDQSPWLQCLQVADEYRLPCMVRESSAKLQNICSRTSICSPRCWEEAPLGCRTSSGWHPVCSQHHVLPVFLSEGRISSGCSPLCSHGRALGWFLSEELHGTQTLQVPRDGGQPCQWADVFYRL